MAQVYSISAAEASAFIRYALDPVANIKPPTSSMFRMGLADVKGAGYIRRRAQMIAEMCNDLDHSVPLSSPNVPLGLDAGDSLKLATRTAAEDLAAQCKRRMSAQAAQARGNTSDVELAESLAEIQSGRANLIDHLRVLLQELDQIDEADRRASEISY